ncbi:MAG TPA: pyruvate kinase [Candidatus Paceibacterota bacterium]
MHHSRAQIIATIGPLTRSIDYLRVLIDRGVDVIRLDFSQEIFEEHRRTIHNLRIAASDHHRYIPIIGDLVGPRIEQDSRSHYSHSSLSPITEHDREAIAFGIEQEIDYVALAYVGSSDDVQDLQNILWEKNSRARIIAKIERIEALRNINNIVDTADAIMIARDNLGNDVPIEQIPYIQHNIISIANWAHKPVITTEMLHSMISSPTPTRADISDIASAIISGSDALVLDRETADGKYPIEAVEMMDRAILEAERHVAHRDAHTL